MERLTHKRNNGVKDGYWSPNKKDELVTRLARYENTGLEPEELKQLQHDGNTIADQIRSMFDQCKVIKLNENTEVMIQFTEKMKEDYEKCNFDAYCEECSLGFLGIDFCIKDLLDPFPELEEELKRDDEK